MFHTNLYFLVIRLPYSNSTQDNGGQFKAVGPPRTFLLLSHLTMKLSAYEDRRQHKENGDLVT